MRLALFFTLAALGCTQRPDYETPIIPPSAKAGAPTKAAVRGIPRTFGPGQLAKVGCVKEDGENLVGADCAGGFVVFGPVAPAAVGSSVTLSFSITPKEDALVSAELAADSDKVLYARASNIVAKAGAATPIALETRLLAGTSTLESRVAVFSGKPASFVITGLLLDIK
jgi:hypothetical protein